MRVVVLTAFFLATAGLGAASAQTPAQREMMTTQDKALAQQAMSTNDACGTTIATSIDWPSFLAAEIGNNSVSDFCGQALQTLRDMCGDDMAKQSIADRIKSYQCRFGGTDQRDLALDDSGKLTLTIDWDATDYDSYIRGWLADHL